MRNWARVGAGLLGSGNPTSSIYDLGVRVDRYVATAPPVLIGEADDVDEALQAVPIRYRQVIMQFWAYEGRELRWHGRHRGINGNTFEVWVIFGHTILVPALASHIERCRQRASNLSGLA